MFTQSKKRKERVGARERGERESGWHKINRQLHSPERRFPKSRLHLLNWRSASNPSPMMMSKFEMENNWKIPFLYFLLFSLLVSFSYYYLEPPPHITAGALCYNSWSFFVYFLSPLSLTFIQVIGKRHGQTDGKRKETCRKEPVGIYI